jgi:protocatechuate 3,4-dioxygenase beta subunit
MQRRTFLRDTALGAIAVSASGFISFDGTKYVGDCETTTDILGPFYRPGSPVRTNLLIPGDAGTKILLSGKIKHSDCVTPFKKAKVEIWHCSATGEYDNTTDEFRYRATTYTDNEGKYSFNTILPVPYKTSGDNYRPAHYHLMVTAENYQQLITQVYFEGDDHLSKDSSSSSPSAKRRILKIQTLPDKTKKVDFDVSLSEKLAAEISAIDKLAGSYKFENGASDAVFFKNENSLWIKKDAFGFNMEYIGNNSFRSDDNNVFKFVLLSDGKIKLEQNSGGKINTAYKII